MKELKAVFTIAAGVFAAIPGIGLLSANLQILPGESRMLYGGVLEALSIMTLLSLWLKRKKIEKLPAYRAIRMAFWYVSAFLVFLLLYIFLLQSHVKENIIFPFFPTGDLKMAIEKYKSFDEIIRVYHQEGTQTLIASSNITLTLTKILFLILFQVPMIMLVISFCILGINIKKIEE
jgi:hypothetical protein